jgi:hypothetical protein
VRSSCAAANYHFDGGHRACASGEAEMRLHYCFLAIYDTASERWGFAEEPRLGN